MKDPLSNLNQKKHKTSLKQKTWGQSTPHPLGGEAGLPSVLSAHTLLSGGGDTDTHTQGTAWEQLAFPPPSGLCREGEQLRPCHLSGSLGGSGGAALEASVYQGLCLVFWASGKENAPRHLGLQPSHRDGRHRWRGKSVLLILWE